LDARLRLAGGEQRAAVGVVGEGGEVVEAVERLDEPVEDVQRWVERVLQVVGADRRVDADALGWRDAEDAQRRARALEVARLLKARGGARQRLDARPLRQPADPWRAPAVEAEQRLPRDATGARDGVPERLVEQRAQLGVARLDVEQAVGATEGAQ